MIQLKAGNGKAICPARLVLRDSFWGFSSPRALLTTYNTKWGACNGLQVDVWAMPRIKTTPSAVVAARNPTHYHLILRPVLQRRFARSSLWTFVVCYAISYLMGDRHGLNPPRHLKDTNMRLGFSLLFPWSATSFRALLLFATVFPVLILRKAELHGMSWTLSTASQLMHGVVQFLPHSTMFSVLSKEIISLNIIHTMLTYLISALALTCLYLRNKSPTAGLTITISRSGCVYDKLM